MTVTVVSIILFIPSNKLYIVILYKDVEGIRFISTENQMINN